MRSSRPVNAIVRRHVERRAAVRVNGENAEELTKRVSEGPAQFNQWGGEIHA
jgi:hypothetical protein